MRGAVATLDSVPLARLELEFAFLWPVSVGLLLITLALCGLSMRRADTTLAGLSESDRTRRMLVTLRACVLLTLALVVLGPVWHRPATPRDLGALAVVVDLHPTMFSHDRQRPPAERLRLAMALGRYSDPDAELVASWIQDVETLRRLAAELTAARAARDFVDISRADPTLPRQRFQRAQEDFARSTQAVLAAPSHPAAAALRRIPLAGDGLGTSAWLEGVIRRLADAESAIDAERQRRYTAAIMEGGSTGHPASRAAADVAAMTRLDLARALLEPGGPLGEANSRAIRLVVYAPWDDRRDRDTLRAFDVEGELAAAGGLVDAVHSYLARSTTRQLRGVVILSDGVSLARKPIATASAAHPGVPVHTVFLASDRPPPSLELTTLQAPARLGPREPLDLRFQLVSRGLAAPVDATVTLSAGSFAQSQRVRVGVEAERDTGTATEIRFQFLPQRPGEIELRVEATAEGLAPARWRGRVRVSDDRRRVVLLGSMPTRDAHRLERTLRKRNWVELHTFWATGPATEMNATAETLDMALRSADAAILADTTPDAWGGVTADGLTTMMADRAGRVLLLPGPNATPQGVVLDATLARWLGHGNAETPPRWTWWRSPAADGSLAAVPTTDWPAQSPHADRWTSLPRLWRQLDTSSPELNAIPLLVDMATGRRLISGRRVGSGLLLWLHTDQAWRWLAGPVSAVSGSPDDLASATDDPNWPFEALADELLEPPFAEVAGEVALDAPTDVEPGEPVPIRVRALRADGTAGELRTRSVQLRFAGRTVATAPLSPAVQAAMVVPGRWTATLPAPREVGDYVLQIEGLEAPRLTVSVGRAAEQADPAGRPDLLAAWSAATGGLAVAAAEVDRLAQRLAEPPPPGAPGAEVVVRLWNSAYLAVALIALLSGEWALRKHWGMA